MPGLIFSEFGGVAPKIAPLQLADGLAQQAINTRFDRGRLEPWAENKATGVTFPTNTKTLFYYRGTHWFEWSQYVDAVRAPLAYDPYEYVIFTQSDYPRVTRNDVALTSAPYPSASYRLGVPAPSNPPTVAVNGAAPASPDPADAVTYQYVYTFVDAFGREGPSTLASDSVTIYEETQTVDLGFDAFPTGNYNWGAGAKRRIYRTNTGSDGGVFQYVGETVGTSFNDAVPSDALGEALATADWFGPPDDDTSLYPDGPLTSLTQMPNNYLAGAAGSEVCFSERTQFHAWPIDYRIALDHPVVGMAVAHNGLFVATTGNPYIIQGSDPASMSEHKIESNQACVSKQSIVDMGDYIIYASPDGLCIYANADVKVATEDVFTRNEWATLNPSSIQAFQYEGLYIGFYDNGTKGGFVFNPRGGKASFSYLDFFAVAGFQDLHTGTLYLLLESGSLVTFNDDTTKRTYTWQSAPKRLPDLHNFALIQVEAQEYPVTVTVKASAPKHGELSSVVITANDNYPQYLPSGFTATDWEISVTGTAPVLYVKLADDFEDF